jgi:hypothetical protein
VVAFISRANENSRKEEEDETKIASRRLSERMKVRARLEEIYVLT